MVFGSIACAKMIPATAISRKIKKLVSFFILRYMAVAGIILAHEIEPKTLYIGLDFAVPQFRDFKLGKYIYTSNDNYFSQLGFETICTKSKTKKFTAYLKKMDFKEKDYNNEVLFSKQLKLS